MKTVITSVEERLTESRFLSKLSDSLDEGAHSFALWRLPAEKTKHILVSTAFQRRKKDDLLEESPAGFVFNPFDSAKEGYFLPADFLFTVEVDDNKMSMVVPRDDESLNWLDNLPELRAQTNFQKTRLQPTDENKLRSGYLHLVEMCQAEIANGTVEKIVPSRRHFVELPDEFDPFDAFKKLCAAYPNAFVSCVSVPGEGVWIGASPELLVSVSDNTIFKTVALAGTKLFDEHVNLKSVAWTEKEIEEQALVERYIISCFKKIRLREYDEHGPKTVVAGNLLHLKSEFTVDMKATNFPQLGSIMLQLLHPTSAVCGMPLAPALEFLSRHEGYDREFYAGFLGPVNINNQTNIYVNIRCMKIQGNVACCYAGAGITAESEPEDEWNETALKLKTVLKIVL